jgi:calcineurin-like phosphoesterase family protein
MEISAEAQKAMESIWFVADLHAQHPKIVDICDRPVSAEHK